MRMPSTAVVCLGQALLPNGNMPISLVNRVSTSSKLLQDLCDSREAVCLLLSGGDVKNTGLSEARTMSAHFESKYGDSFSSLEVILEERSRNTLENCLFCKPYLEQLCCEQVFIVTSDFHLPRTMLIARAILGDKMECIGVPAVSSHARNAAWRPRALRPADPHEWNLCEMLEGEKRVVDNMTEWFAGYRLPPLLPSSIELALEEIRQMNSTLGMPP